MVIYWLDIRKSEENLFYSPASVTILSFTPELILPSITRNGISKSYRLSSKYFLLDLYFEIVEVEAPIFWLPDTNCWLFGKVPDAGKDWGQKKRASKNEMAGWHHQFNRHELGQTLGSGEGPRGLAYCSPWGHKESDKTGQLNNNSLYFSHHNFSPIIKGFAIVTTFFWH